MAAERKHAKQLLRAKEITAFIDEASLQECKLLFDDLVNRFATLGVYMPVDAALCSINMAIMEGDRNTPDLPTSPLGGMYHGRATGRGVRKENKHE